MAGSLAKKSTTPAATTKRKPSSKAKNGRSSPALLKVVVRRLPHQMKEDEFLAALVAATADAGMGERGGSWDLMYFTSGKMSKKRGRVTSTAYLHIDRGRGAAADLSLIKLRAAVLASDAMAGGTAKDSNKHGEKGTSTAAGPMVDLAPFQKLFKQKPKRDARLGTIEKDTDFRAFCAALQSPAPPLPSADVQADIRESEGKEEPKPQNALLDFLKERGAKKVRDSQRVAALGSSSSYSSRGNRRGTSGSSSSSGGSGGAATTSSAASASASSTSSAAGATMTAKTTTTTKSSSSKGGAPPTPTKGTSSRASSSASDLADKPKKDAEKETARGQSRPSGGSSRAPRGGSSGGSGGGLGGPGALHPPSPPPAVQRAAGGSGRGAPASASTSSRSGLESKSRSAGRGSGRVASRGGKNAASSSAASSASHPATAAAVPPSSILSKANDAKTKSPSAVPASVLSTAGSTSSPRSGSGGARRNRQKKR